MTDRKRMLHSSSLSELAAEWRRRPLAPVLLLIACCALAAFFLLSRQVGEQEIRRFDEAVLLALHPAESSPARTGSLRVAEMARDLTALGGFTLITAVTIIACGVALLAGKFRLAALGAGSVLAGSVLMDQLKQGFARPRPELVEHGVPVFNASFPSGHSLMATIVYLTLGIVLARTQPKKRVRIFIVMVAAAVPMLVGLSRVYLGVHWPTDVIAGWLLGITWALIFWLLARKIDPLPGAPSRST